MPRNRRPEPPLPIAPMFLPNDGTLPAPSMPGHFIEALTKYEYQLKLSERKRATAMASMRETISMGIAVAVAVLAAIMGAFVWIALPLLALAVFLFAWALEPTRAEAFVRRLPYSNYPLKALAKLDSILPARKLSEP
jgi:hypothetical protein